MANQISYEGIKAQCGTDWTTSTSGSTSGTTLYINSPSFVFRIWGHCEGMHMRIFIYADVYYYNTDTATWVTAQNMLIDRENWFTSSDGSGEEKKFYHNRGGEGTTSADAPKYHRWKVDIRARGGASAGDGYIGTWGWSWSVWCGGLNMMTESQYNAICKDSVQKIYYSDVNYYIKGASNSYASDDAFINGTSFTKAKGTRIDATNAVHVCPRG